MPRRRERTAYGRKRARDKFWQEHAETVRVVLIAGGTIAAVSLLAQMMLR
jgi:hypothetical protein